MPRRRPIWRGCSRQGRRIIGLCAAGILIRACARSSPTSTASRRCSPSPRTARPSCRCSAAITAPTSWPAASPNSATAMPRSPRPAKCASASPRRARRGLGARQSAGHETGHGGPAAAQDRAARTPSPFLGRGTSWDPGFDDHGARDRAASEGSATGLVYHPRTLVAGRLRAPRGAAELIGLAEAGLPPTASHPPRSPPSPRSTSRPTSRRSTPPPGTSACRTLLHGRRTQCAKPRASRTRPISWRRKSAPPASPRPRRCRGRPDAG